MVKERSWLNDKFINEDIMKYIVFIIKSNLILKENRF